MDSLLATSPQSVTGHHLSARFKGEGFDEQERCNDSAAISFSGFKEQIPDVIEKSNRLAAEGSVTYGSEDDPIMKLFR